MLACRDGVYVPDQHRDQGRRQLSEDNQCPPLLVPVGDPTSYECLEDHVEYHGKGREQRGLGDSESQEESEIDGEVTIEQAAP